MHPDSKYIRFLSHPLQMAPHLSLNKQMKERKKERKKEAEKIIYRNKLGMRSSTEGMITKTEDPLKP